MFVIQPSGSLRRLSTTNRRPKTLMGTERRSVAGGWVSSPRVRRAPATASIATYTAALSEPWCVTKHGTVDPSRSTEHVPGAIPHCTPGMVLRSSPPSLFCWLHRELNCVLALALCAQSSDLTWRVECLGLGMQHCFSEMRACDTEHSKAQPVDDGGP